MLQIILFYPKITENARKTKRHEPKFMPSVFLGRTPAISNDNTYQILRGVPLH
ncbi:hypothetical protein [Moraxella lacunata]|uniref:hypothetical protein n=1 Tax=Moraxella lacunata TaxID=477 RepID=UPI003EDEA6CF